jgi:hypothetical protein
MKTKALIGFLLITPSFVLAQSGATTNSLGTCGASLPSVDAKRCNEQNYFTEYRKAADDAVNAENDRLTNEVFQDNQANNETVVGTAKTNLANMGQCQLDICQAYFDTCTSSDIDDVSSRRFETTSGECLEQGEKRFAVAKDHSSTVVKMNVQIKSIATIEEKARAIAARTKEIVLPMLQNIAKITREWAGKGSSLVEQTRDVDGSTVQ